MDGETNEVIILKADGYQFPCNKKKLIASSDYFRAMFSNNFSEKDKEVIMLKDIDGECLKILLEYAETGTYNIPSDCTLALLQTAAMLQFTDIQLACEREVFRSLSCESCLEIYAVTASLGLSNIAKSARTIALWNFCKIITTPKYLQLSLEAMVEYLSDPSLFTGPNGEWTVWEAINTWIEENEEERVIHIKELLTCLDFKSLSADDISNMLFYNVICENDELVQILEGIRKYKREQASQCSYLSGTDGGQTISTAEKSSDSLDSDKTLESEKLQESVSLFLNCLTRKLSVYPSVVGFKRLLSNQKKKAKNSDDEDDNCMSISKEYKDVMPVLYVFNPSNGKIHEEFPLTKVCHGPVLCSGFQVCSVGPSVYILGGEFLYGHGNWNHSLWRYSTATKKWIVEDSLPKPRRHHMMCAVDSIIYILGGLGRHRVVQNSVNAYDTESGKWLPCPDMPHCVSNGAACAFKGRVLVFTHEMQLLTYYPSTRKWSAIPLRSPTKHGYRAALAWKNHIYLIDHCSTKVYRYYPEGGHSVVEYGYFLAPPINVCIVDGKIYSFSHDDLDNHVIEVLDIEDDLGNIDNTVAHGGRIDKHTCDNGEREDIGDANILVADYCDKSRKVPKKVIASREVWKEGDDGPHIFTTKCPADVTFSLGCFPLMKL
ncbi:kelch-like protein 30 [Macrobrachium rosenbergii]|uniref:kelch-like protein 30 n=1 Tax=Macrobrachium rosenbergii TaxID=79674 RepID=UPI0034D41E7C